MLGIMAGMDQEGWFALHGPSYLAVTCSLFSLVRQWIDMLRQCYIPAFVSMELWQTQSRAASAVGSTVASRDDFNVSLSN